MLEKVLKPRLIATASSFTTQQLQSKTKGMRVITSNVQKLSLEETEIEEDGSFIYLGSVVSVNGGTEEDVASRIKKENAVIVQLYPVWRNHTISKGVKIRIFFTNVKSVLLYGCETWKTTNQVTRRLQTFINECLRRIMNKNGRIRLQKKN
jgi:hypothetical protein